MCRIFNVQHTEMTVHISVRHTEMTEHIECVAVLLGVLHSYSMCRFLTLCVADPIWGVCCSSYTLHSPYILFFLQNVLNSSNE